MVRTSQNKYIYIYEILQEETSCTDSQYCYDWRKRRNGSELVCIANKWPSLSVGLIRLTNSKILCNFPADECMGKVSVLDVLWQNVFIFFISLQLPVFSTHSFQEQIWLSDPKGSSHYISFFLMNFTKPPCAGININSQTAFWKAWTARTGWVMSDYKNKKKCMKRCNLSHTL